MIRSCFTLGLFILINITISAQEAEYLWPTNSGNYLSSTFGETRSAHFHAGLDIKTWGREGYHVFASKDGFVSKLLITNQGYGKAIYLRHYDGSYTVYAHLQRFNPELQSIADSIRIKDFSYTLEKDMTEDSLKVVQGEVIGFTGSTGIGPPHLHFEIRNQYNEPVNPLTKGFIIKDTKTPVIRSLLIEPLNIDSKINKSVYPQEILPDSTKNDTAYFGATTISGEAGISINTFDRADEVYNRYAVYRLSLSRNDEIIFQQQLDKFNFSTDDYMFLDRKSLTNEKTRKFQTLYRKENFDHPFLKIDSKKSLEEGIYIIKVEDYFGNTSFARVPILKEKPNKPKNQQKFTLSGHWSNDWVSVNDSVNINLVDFQKGAKWNSASQHFLYAFPDSLNQGIFRVDNSRVTQIKSPDNQMKIFIPEGAFFSDLSIRYNYTESDSSFEISLGSSNLVIRNEIFLQIYLDDKAFSNTLLYRKSKDDYAPVNSFVRGGTLYATISEFGDFISLRDTIPPTIHEPEVTLLGNGKKTYSINTNDDLSGIDFQSAVFLIDGMRGIAEYDYESDKFTFYHPDWNLKSAIQEIYFEVKDRAGNISRETFRL